MNRARIITTVALLFLVVSFSLGQEVPKLKVTDLPSLPALEASTVSLGYAGIMGGVHNEVIIAAGGANFPEALPWKGGKKVYSNEIYLLKENNWKLLNKTLPFPIAYGASVSIPEGVLIIGGENGDKTVNSVYLLRYVSPTDDVEIIEYPSLPEPLAYTAAVVEEDYIYIVGGKNADESTNAFTVWTSGQE